MLETHRGYDIGALAVAMRIAKRRRSSLLVGEITRLLIDLNRSSDSPTLFSEYSSALSDADLRHLRVFYYERYRNWVSQAVESVIAGNRAVTHISVHSFTPVFNATERPFDIGLLFDTERPKEANYMHHWAGELRAAIFSLRIRENEPYQGTDDGLSTVCAAGSTPINTWVWNLRSISG